MEKKIENGASTDVTITAVEYARSVLPESMVFAGGDPNRTRPIVFFVYLVRTPGHCILVDAGCDTMPGFVMEDFIGPVRALAQHGVAPEDVTDVLITHAHHDHIEGVVHFPRATVYIQRAEYEADGKNYIPKEQRLVLFDQEAWIGGAVHAICIGGHSCGSCIAEIRIGEETYILAGDECYARECLTRQIPTGCSCCPEKSRAFVEEYSKDTYTVLLCHDL